MILEITLFRGFPEDNRLSMDIYADGLRRALQASCSERCRVFEYRPSLLPWPRFARGSRGPLRMRLSRFAAYPCQALQQRGKINHIVEQGYGHLLYVVNPQRTVVTVHDLIPLLSWRGQIPAMQTRRKPWLSLFSFHALKRAAHLIAVSENTRRDLIQHCGCAADRITVIHNGIDPIFRPYSAEERGIACHSWNLPADGIRRVLVTGHQTYKNLSGALQAFARLQELYVGELQLIKTGPATSEWLRVVEALNLKATTISLGFVPRSLLPDLFNIADCLLFPSFYEGFGCPPLEAMACGTPVVTSNAGSLPEVVADAGIMLDPQDHEGLAQAMYSVLTRDDLRSSLIERGLARARQFTWEKAAQKTLEVYERIARR